MLCLLAQVLPSWFLSLQWPLLPFLLGPSSAQLCCSRWVLLFAGAQSKVI